MLEVRSYDANSKRNEYKVHSVYRGEARYSDGYLKITSEEETTWSSHLRLVSAIHYCESDDVDADGAEVRPCFHIIRTARIDIFSCDGASCSALNG